MTREWCLHLFFAAVRPHLWCACARKWLEYRYVNRGVKTLSPQSLRVRVNCGIFQMHHHLCICISYRLHADYIYNICSLYIRNSNIDWRASNTRCFLPSTYIKYIYISRPIIYILPEKWSIINICAHDHSSIVNQLMFLSPSLPLWEAQRGSCFASKKKNFLLQTIIFG